MKINTHEHIGVSLVDSRLKQISLFDGNFRNLHDHFVGVFDNNPEYPFISTIDPYSDTLLNSVQVPILIRELQQLVNKDNDPEVAESVNNLIEYLSTITVHNFIKFSGD